MMSEHLKFLLVKKEVTDLLDSAETIGQAREIRDLINNIVDSACEQKMDRLLDTKYGGK